MTRILLLFSFVLFLGFRASAEEVPQEIRLVIEGSDAKESTFVVMEYREGDGIRYLECEKPVGRVAQLVKDKTFDMEKMKCVPLHQEAISLEQVKEIRARANDFSFFEAYAGNEKKWGCGMFRFAATAPFFSYLVGVVAHRLTPRQRCLLVMRQMENMTVVEPVHVGNTYPTWKESARETYELLRDWGPSRKIAIGAVSTALLGAAMCAQGTINENRIAEKGHDTRWIFAHDPQQGTGAAAEPLNHYSASKLTVEDIKRAIHNR